MKINRIFCMLIALISIFSLSGCYDDKEIDETAYIIALGIDTSEDSGYSYTFQFSAPLATGGSSEGGESGSKAGGEGGDENKNPTVRNIVVTAPDFYTAKNMTNNFLSKNVDMSHLKLIVFSQEVDRDGFLNHSQFLLREREVRPHTAVAVSINSAEEYIKSVNPELEANTAKYYELMSLRSNNVYSPTKRLAEFVDEINSEYGVSILPVAAATDGEAKDKSSSATDDMWVGINDSAVKSGRSDFRGLAVFKNGQMSGIMDGDCAMIFNILNRDIRSCTLTLKNPYTDDDVFSFRLTVPSRAVYAIEQTKKPCNITVSQGLNIEFFGTVLPEGFKSHEELCAYAKSVITQKFTEYFYDLSRGKQADIMKIGDCYKKLFLTEEAFDSSDWEQLFNSADFKVEISFI